VASAAITLAAFAVGLRWGAIGVAGAYSLASVLLLPLGAIYCFQRTPVGMGDVLSALARPALAAIGAGVALYFAAQSISIASLPAAVALHAFLFAAVYASIWMISPGGIGAAVEFFQLRRELQSSRRTPA
jgi:PST family polysaccharide transporter